MSLNCSPLLNYFSATSKNSENEKISSSSDEKPDSVTDLFEQLILQQTETVKELDILESKVNDTDSIPEFNDTDSLSSSLNYIFDKINLKDNESTSDILANKRSKTYLADNFIPKETQKISSVNEEMNKICITNKDQREVQNDSFINLNHEMELLLIINNFKPELCNQNDLEKSLILILKTIEGSKYFQNQLDGMNVVLADYIFDIIKPAFCDLFRKEYSNFFIQKLYFKISSSKRESILVEILNKLEAIFKKPQGTFSMLYLLENTVSEKEISIIVSHLAIHYKSIFSCKAQNKIFECIFGCFEAKNVSCFYNFAIQNIHKLSQYREGFYLLRSLFRSVKDTNVQINIAKTIAEKASAFIKSNNGCLLIQCIFHNFLKSKYVYTKVATLKSKTIVEHESLLEEQFILENKIEYNHAVKILIDEINKMFDQWNNRCLKFILQCAIKNGGIMYENLFLETMNIESNVNKMLSKQESTKLIKLMSLENGFLILNQALQHFSLLGRYQLKLGLKYAYPFLTKYHKTKWKRELNFDDFNSQSFSIDQKETPIKKNENKKNTKKKIAPTLQSNINVNNNNSNINSNNFNPYFQMKTINPTFNNNYYMYNGPQNFIQNFNNYNNYSNFNNNNALLSNFNLPQMNNYPPPQMSQKYFQDSYSNLYNYFPNNQNNTNNYNYTQMNSMMLNNQNLNKNYNYSNNLGNYQKLMCNCIHSLTDKCKCKYNNHVNNEQ